MVLAVNTLQLKLTCTLCREGKKIYEERRVYYKKIGCELGLPDYTRLRFELAISCSVVYMLLKIIFM